MRALLLTLLGAQLLACGGGGVSPAAQGVTPDTTPPSVTSVAPANGDTGVATDVDVTVTFSEPMTDASLTATSFTVSDDSGAPINGAVTVSGNMATFAPASALTGGSRYTATIAADVKDTAGNPLGSAFSWAFTTASPADTTPPTVTSTAPANNDNAVALNAVVSVTLSEPVLAGSVTAGSFKLADSQGAAVSGSVAVSGSTATFTPSANLAPGTTYTATLTTAAQDLAGNPLASDFTWSFTTASAVDGTPPTVTDVAPLDGAIGVPLNAAISANFSENVAASSVNATSFKVAAPGGAAVAGTLSVSGGSVIFTPSASLAASTRYAVNISTAVTDVAGNPLAATYAWSFTTGPAPDTTPPTVSSTSPASGATGVALSAKVAVTFSEAMTNSTLTTASLKVTKTAGNVGVAGTVAVSGTTATFTPASSLAPSTGYTVTVTTAVKDAAGNPLSAAFTWTFTTGAAPDTTPPTVTATTPAANATGVSRSATITATFSESMTNSTISTTSFTLVPAAGGAGVSGTVSIAGTTASFVPSSTLAASTQYTATITTAAKDAAGNPLAAKFTWSFSTVAPADTTPPTVSSTAPPDGASGIAVGSSVSATFSEPMNNSTLSSASFTLTAAGGGGVAGTVSLSGNTATLNPTADLAAGTQYTATITTAAKDLAGNALAANRSWTFTTAAVVSGTPALGAHAVAYKNDGSPGTVSTPSLATQSSGSTFLVCTGRGVVAAQAPVTDNKGNTYSQVGATHTYTAYPNSGTACYVAANGAGGTGHVISAPNSSGAPNDETTLAVVEIKNGSQVKDFKWNEDLSSPLTSLSVTTTGPATLVAFWWGDGGVNVAHTATPNNGFTVVDSLMSMGALVQVSVATKNVATAGTYNITWTSTEGAQLWLMAIQ